MNRQLCDNPFEPQPPSWLLAKVPPPVITLDVVPLVATEDSLPIVWAERQRRVVRLHSRDQRREEKFLRRVDRIAQILCPPFMYREVEYEITDVRERLLRVAEGFWIPREVPSEGSILPTLPPIQYPLPPIWTTPEHWQDVPVTKLFPEVPWGVVKYFHWLGSPESLLVPTSYLSQYNKSIKSNKRKPQPLPEATRKKLLKALSKSPPAVRLAVIEVVAGDDLSKVAKRYALNPESLRKSVYRAQMRLEVPEAWVAETQ